MNLQALRGAVQIENDTPEAIKDGVKQLMSQLFIKNSLEPSQVISVFFSQTKDLRSFNPATAAREVGFEDYTYFCLQELDVEGALENMIRVLIHVICLEDTTLQPVYLGGARKLRPDLFRQ